MKKPLRVLLVRPHAELPTSQWLQSMIRLEPYAQELIAAVVQPPHDVRICDLVVEAKPVRAFRRTLEAYRPDLVGFGGFSSQFATNQALADITRRLCPEARICLGGIHASSVPLECGQTQSFDWIVRGDGVSALRVILEAMEAGREVPTSECILAPAAADFKDLAQRPPPPIHTDAITVRPRRDLVDSSKYFCICYGQKRQKVPTLFPETACVRTSVGCPQRCSFCVVHFLANGKYLQREIDDVVEEIAALPQPYVYFVDDETFIHPKRMKRMAEMLLERGVKKKYLAWARSDTVCRHPELFELWKRAGLEFVYIGFESLRESELDAYNKNATPAQNRQAREILRALDINIHAALMVHPDFEAEDFRVTQQAIREMAPAEFAFTVFSPPPGTPLFNENRDRYICPDPYRYYDCLHTILPTRLPLKKFYKYFTLLYAFGAWHIPGRVHRLRMPLRDYIRFFAGGLRLGRHLMRMNREYDRQYW